MLSAARATHAGLSGLALVASGLRGVASSSAASMSIHQPTYTYPSPGSSMTEPNYFSEPGSSSSQAGGHQVGTMEEVAHRMTPSRKAAVLKVLSTPRRKLSAQGSDLQMLPPGCSISDPSYSIKDPVYFVDGQ